MFLDRDLVIRSFTPAVAKVFNILPTDRGRPVTDLSSRITLPSFAEDIKAVFAGQGPIERRVDDNDHNAHFLIRIAPYRDGDHVIEGVVVTFLDVSSLTRSEARQSMLAAELRHRRQHARHHSIDRQADARPWRIACILSEAA